MPNLHTIWGARFSTTAKACSTGERRKCFKLDSLHIHPKPQFLPLIQTKLTLLKPHYGVRDSLRELRYPYPIPSSIHDPPSVFEKSFYAELIFQRGSVTIISISTTRNSKVYVKYISKQNRSITLTSTSIKPHQVNLRLWSNVDKVKKA